MNHHCTNAITLSSPPHRPVACLIPPSILTLACLAVFLGCAHVQDQAPVVRVLPSTPTSAELELLQVWSDHTSSAKQRAAAVNQCFTNGTPVETIVRVLGTNYLISRTFWSLGPKGDIEPGKTSGLLYVFEDDSGLPSTTNRRPNPGMFNLGGDSVLIRSTAPVGGDPKAAQFAGAVH